MPDKKRVLATIKNITEKKLEDLEEKIESINEIILNISHHWRQPLNNISLLASTIQIKKELNTLSDKDLKNDMGTIVNQTQILSKTIDDFKRLGIYEKKQNEILISEILEKLILIIKPITEKNGIEIIKKINNDFRIVIYENQFIQALLNILHNSIDALLENNQNKRKMIIIGTTKINENKAIKIRDNGGGVEPKNLNKIYEPYFTSKHKSSGKGLGLSYTYKVVKKIHKLSIMTANVNYKFEDNEYTGACTKIMF